MARRAPPQRVDRPPDRASFQVWHGRGASRLPDQAGRHKHRTDEVSRAFPNTSVEQEEHHQAGGEAPLGGRQAPRDDLDRDRRDPARALRSRADESQNLRARRHHRRRDARQRLHPARANDHGLRPTPARSRHAPRVPAHSQQAFHRHDRGADRPQGRSRSSPKRTSNPT